MDKAIYSAFCGEAERTMTAVNTLPEAVKLTLGSFHADGFS